jgi:hypothetical protein
VALSHKERLFYSRWHCATRTFCSIFSGRWAIFQEPLFSGRWATFQVHREESFVQFSLAVEPFTKNRPLRLVWVASKSYLKLIPDHVSLCWQRQSDSSTRGSWSRKFVYGHISPNFHFLFICTRTAMCFSWDPSYFLGPSQCCCTALFTDQSRPTYYLFGHLYAIYPWNIIQTMWLCTFRLEIFSSCKFPIVDYVTNL